MRRGREVYNESGVTMNRRVFLAGVLAACLGGSLAAPKNCVKSAIRLIPVGIDIDGAIVPIRQLHYAGLRSLSARSESFAATSSRNISAVIPRVLAAAMAVADRLAPTRSCLLET